VSGGRDVNRSTAALALSWLLVLGSCRGPLGTQRCAFGPERVVVEGTGSFIRAVSLARRGRELLAAWTDASGTWVTRLDEDGAARERGVRVGPPAESLDLVGVGSGYRIAMLFPGDPIWGGGSAQTRELGVNGRPRGPSIRHGRAGCYSRGISLADHARGGMVAWQDGTPGELAVMVSGITGKPTRITPAEVDGCCPVFGVLRGAPVLFWAQHGLEAEPAKATVSMQRLRPGEVPGPPTAIVETAVGDAWPAFAEDARGFGLIYRDRRATDRYEQLFFLHADTAGAVLSDPVSVGRYNGRTRGVLMNAGPIWAAVEGRTLGRAAILGFDRFDGVGERIGAQLHIFAYDVRFTDVDALRLGTRYLLLYSEDRPRQRVWSAPVKCR
jgi:hypothetical protein